MTSARPNCELDTPQAQLLLRDVWLYIHRATW